MKRYFLSSSLTRATAVVIGALSVAADASAPPIPPVITYEALGCVARCLEYSIRLIWNDVTYEGVKYTKILGRREIKISQHWSEYFSRTIKNILDSKRGDFASQSVKCLGFNPHMQSIKITWFHGKDNIEFYWNFGCVHDFDERTQLFIKNFPEKVRLSSLITGGSSPPFPSFTGTP